MVGKTVQDKKKQSLFPDFPRQSPTVDKDGIFTHSWHLGLSSLFQTIQRNFTNEGIQVPQLDINDINQIQANYTPLIGGTLGRVPNISGKIVYDTTNAVPKVFIITFTTPDDPSSTIVTASWKTFTIT